MSSINSIDILIIGIIFLSALIGFGRGFFREILSLVSLIAAVIVANMFANALAQYFTSSATVQGVITQTNASVGVDTSQSVSYVAFSISYGVLFFGTLLAGSLLSFILNTAFQATFLGFGNRFLGALFGFLRGLIFSIVLVFLLQLSPLGQQPWMKQSKLVATLQPAISWIAKIVSPALNNIKDRLNKTVDQIGGSAQSLSP